MLQMQSASPIEYWLADIRSYVVENSPDLLDILDVYLDEALFGRKYIHDDLLMLPLGASILEVGAGSLLLSSQLVREGFEVTALEPIGHGFSHFARLQELVLQRATIYGCMPKLLDQCAEQLSENDCFDYAFSINVMEHVENVEDVIVHVADSLKPLAVYRFTCPNYLFPYEPHFNIPTLITKENTFKLLSRKILLNKNIPDPKGTWDSLNWIDVIKIRKIIKSHSYLKAKCNTNVIVNTLERIVSDKSFSMRRSRFVRGPIFMLVWLKLHHLFGFIPAIFQPVIDCALTRTGGGD